MSSEENQGRKRSGGKPFGKKAFGAKGFGKKPFGKKGFGNRPFGEGRRGRGERAAAGEQAGGEAGAAGASRSASGAPRSAAGAPQSGGERPYGKPFGKGKGFGKGRPFGDKKPFGKGRPFGKKKPFGKGKPPRDDEGADPAGERLQKVMSAAGVGSRRHCEELIEAGRVEIDGRKAKLGDRVGNDTQQIRIDGETLKAPRRLVYYLVNKPEGVVSTNYDQGGRPRVIDLVPQHEGEHLFPVGRLDLSSEGLILVTNDGELANLLTHPRYGVEKTYLALVAGQPSQEVYDKLRQGVHLAEGVAQCAYVHVRKALAQSTLLEIVLQEGKNREIRRVLAKVGHKVLTLKRIAIGRVKLKDLRPGESRRCTSGEIEALREATFESRTADRGRRGEAGKHPSKVDPAGAEPGATDADGATSNDPGATDRPTSAPASNWDEAKARFEKRPQYGDRPPRKFEKGAFGKRKFEGNSEPRTSDQQGAGDRPRGKRFGDRPAYGGGQGGQDRPPFRQGKRPPRDEGKRFERKPRFGDRKSAEGGSSEGGRPPEAGAGQGGRPSFLPRASRTEGDASGYGGGPGGKKPMRKRRAKPLFPNRKKRGGDEPPINRTVIGDE